MENNDIVEDEVMEKEINQMDKIDKSVDKIITDMSTIWKTCSDKLLKDNTCFICKNEIADEEQFDIVAVPESKTDKGLFVLASICTNCNKETIEGETK